MAVGFAPLVAVALSVLYVRWMRRKATDLPLPPGPKPWPIIGNLFDMSLQEMWLPATRWAKEFGSYILHCSATFLIYS